MMISIKLPRFDSRKKSCVGQGGIMDYAQSDENDKSCWSTCSVEDFTVLMNKNKTCLSVIDLENPPPNPDPPKLTKNECDISNIYPGLSGVHTLYLNGNYIVFVYILCVVGRVTVIKYKNCICRTKQKVAAIISRNHLNPLLKI
jgi:hypothetical protein